MRTRRAAPEPPDVDSGLPNEEPMAGRTTSRDARTPESGVVPALQARIAALEAREAEHERSERVEAALYRIAAAASEASDLQEFYREVHATVAELMYAENFYIALYDDERKAINFPYNVDTVDPDVPDPTAWDQIGEGWGRSQPARSRRSGSWPKAIGSEHHSP